MPTLAAGIDTIAGVPAAELAVRFVFWVLTGATVLSFNLASAADLRPAVGTPYRQWAMGPSPDPGFFPLAVWLQSPAKAEQYRKAGINTYVALWKGPTDEQLAALTKAGLKVICHQNEAGPPPQG